MRLLKEIFTTIWKSRGFIVSAIKSDIKGQYARSQFGFAWLIIHPLSQALMFALVLSKIMAARIPGVEGTFGYALYLLSGLLAWTLFIEIVSRSQNMFIEYANSMKKISFPRISIPFIVTGRALINNLILLVAVMFVYALFAFYPHQQYLWLPLIMLLNLALAVGIGVILGILNVFIRDIGQIMQVALQFWFWFTPIVYPISIIPEAMLPIVKLNPMYHIVTWYHEIMVFKNFTFDKTIAQVALLAIALILVAMILFRRASGELVDVL